MAQLLAYEQLNGRNELGRADGIVHEEFLEIGEILQFFGERNSERVFFVIDSPPDIVLVLTDQVGEILELGDTLAQSDALLPSLFIKEGRLVNIFLEGASRSSGEVGPFPFGDVFLLQGYFGPHNEGEEQFVHLE